MKVAESKDQPGFYIFNCPGCKCSHFINTNPANGAVWEFNFDMEKPTVSPSLLVRMPWKDEMKTCHSFVRNGNIQFLNDCTHELAGQTVEIPEIE